MQLEKFPVKKCRDEKLCHQIPDSNKFYNPSICRLNLKHNKNGLLHSRALHHTCNTNTLTDVSRQWRVWPWQGGRGAGKNEAFPVTGPATATHREQRSDQYYLHLIGSIINTRHRIAGAHLSE